MKQEKLVPKIGEYVQLKYDVIDFDKDHIGKYFKITSIKRLSVNSSGELQADLYIDHNFDRKSWYLTLSQVELIPKEIYESPLFQAMSELDAPQKREKE